MFVSVGKMISDWDRKIAEFRLNILKGNTEKLFDQEYVVLDILKVIY